MKKIQEEKLDIVFLFFIFPKINEISVKFYLVIRISNLKKFYAFELRIIILFIKSKINNLHNKK